MGAAWTAALLARAISSASPIGTSSAKSLTLLEKQVGKLGDR